MSFLPCLELLSNCVCFYHSLALPSKDDAKEKEGLKLKLFCSGISKKFGRVEKIKPINQSEDHCPSLTWVIKNHLWGILNSLEVLMFVNFGIFKCGFLSVDILNFFHFNISLIHKFHQTLTGHIELKHELHKIIHYISIIISNVENEIVGCT